MSLRFSFAMIALGIASAAHAQSGGHVHGGSDANAPLPMHQAHPMDPTLPSHPTGEMIDLKLPDGSVAKAYLTKPKGAPQGAVLVLHEWWGLNDHIKHEADKLTRLGFIALAPDLYNGKVATKSEDAQKLVAALDWKRGMAIEKSGLDYLRQAAPGKKLATLGWCIGGAQSLLAMLTEPEAVSATVIYYGIPLGDDGKPFYDAAALKRFKGNVLGIWAKKDGWITPERVQAFDKALTDAGVKHEFHSYDADHAFANPSDPRHNEQAAQDADAKRTDFLVKNIRG